MKFFHKCKSNFIEEIIFVTHKGRRTGYKHSLNVHGKNAHEIIYVDHGRIVLTINGIDLHLSSGDCVFIAGGTVHGFSGENGAAFDYLNIMFTGNIPKSIFGKCLAVKHKCLEIMEELKEESVLDASYCREIISALLLELTVRMLRQVECSIPNRLHEAVNRNKYCSVIVNKAMNIIAKKYPEPLSLKKVSIAVGIGESRLAKLLKLETGENFTLILQKQRIIAAKHLLHEGIFSLPEIAVAVGYHSTSCFFKIFKRTTGMTPKKYSQSLGDPSIKD